MLKFEWNRWEMIKMFKFEWNMGNQTKCWNFSANRQFDQNVDIWVKSGVSQKVNVLLK